MNNKFANGVGLIECAGGKEEIIMTKEKLFKLNLQMFTEPGAEGGAQSGAEGGTDEGAEDKSFDDWLAENKEFQAEFDRRNEKAITTAKTNWEKDANKRVEDAKTKAQRLADMTDEEKATEAERERMDALEERERELNKRELKATAIDILAEKELPIKLAEVLYYEDENTTKEHIDAVATAFSEAVQAEVDKRLVNSVDVPGGNGASGQTSTRSERIAKERNKQEAPKTSLWG